jgi:NAD-dependent SIR2 family protein deacetylase
MFEDMFEEIVCEKCGNKYPYDDSDKDGYSDCPRCTEVRPTMFGDWIRIPKQKNTK